MTTPDAETTEPEAAKPHRRWRKTTIALGILIAVVLVVTLVTSLTPWPSAMAIRAVFTQGGDATAAEMEKHVPDTALTETLDVAYGDDGVDTTMDVFTPASADQPLPTIVWIHGGAWVSGSKENVDPYLRILMRRGYTTIAVNYTLGPEGHLPHRCAPGERGARLHRRARRRPGGRRVADRPGKRLHAAPSWPVRWRPS
ncbi:alpha/beta hydrolase [Microbacterium sp. M28]|uniref:alpha/beta hydrolase n=1 Tax=Microbacterium sp. M28 TaxID=2962064 RepID=UPI0021F4FBE9|nr:alpha/beta hydrolase [Microbacterium sp. M28]UYO97660.1 alpha/beta hydrolase [Microbacterium sp. M28]